MRQGSRALSWASLLAVAALVAFAACDDDDDSTSGTATATQAPAPALTTTPEPGATAAPFEGNRDPVETTETVGEPPAILVDVRTGQHDGFDRVTFEFKNAVPTYRVEYVSPPVQECGSGFDVEVDGDALLQALFSPAAAHEVDTGEATFGPQELTPGLPSIAELQSTCDFEGQVIWVAGLAEEADFRVHELTEPFRIAIDVAHPE